MVIGFRCLQPLVPHPAVPAPRADQIACLRNGWVFLLL